MTKAIRMSNFTPLSGAIGGAPIGLSAVLLMLTAGRISGISGIFGGLFAGADKGWRGAFLPGLLVGFGTRLGGGCTSGHGVCGIARFSPRSIAATCIFMVVAILTVAVTRHV